MGCVERWKEARGALEQGACLGDDEEEAEEDGVEATNYARPPTPPSKPNGHLPNGHIHGRHNPPPVLAQEAEVIPPASQLLPPLPDHPPPSKQDMFEQALQLRLSQVVLAEYVEGPEGAGEKWVDTFSWIAERKGVVAERRKFSSSATFLLFANLILVQTDYLLMRLGTQWISNLTLPSLYLSSPRKKSLILLRRSK